MEQDIDIIIERCIKHDRESQELLYRRYADKMYNVAMTYASDEGEASDILQDGFIKVFRNLKKYKVEGSFEGWVRRIMVNTALEYKRKSARYNEVIEDASFESDTLHTGFSNILDELGVAEIIKAVNDLPSKACLVMKLYAIEGYSHKEIAEELGISQGTSKSQLNRARAMLSAKLNNR